MNTIQGTVVVQHVTDNGYTEQVKLYASAASTATNTFAKDAPKMTIELTVDHPDAKGFLKPGKQYRVEFTPIE